MILVVHGNIGLRAPFGEQIHRVAEDLAALGYVTAVPRYYLTDPAEPIDQDAPSHVPTRSPRSRRAPMPIRRGSACSAIRSGPRRR